MPDLPLTVDHTGKNRFSLDWLSVTREKIDEQTPKYLLGDGIMRQDPKQQSNFLLPLLLFGEITEVLVSLGNLSRLRFSLLYPPEQSDITCQVFCEYNYEDWFGVLLSLLMVQPRASKPLAISFLIYKVPGASWHWVRKVSNGFTSQDASISEVVWTMTCSIFSESTWKPSLSEYNGNS